MRVDKESALIPFNDSRKEGGLRAVSLCSSESVEETQKSSGEAESKSARNC